MVMTSIAANVEGVCEVAALTILSLYLASGVDFYFVAQM